MDATKRRDGRRGEQAVYELERRRLRNAGRADLAERVSWYADKRAFGDRDIDSFEVDGTAIHIEVKSTSDPRMQFCTISPSEFRLARRVGGRYYIYRVTRVREARPAIDRVRDPYQLIVEARLHLEVGDLVINFGAGEHSAS